MCVPFLAVIDAGEWGSGCSESSDRIRDADWPSCVSPLSLPSSVFVYFFELNLERNAEKLRLGSGSAPDSALLEDWPSPLSML